MKTDMFEELDKFLGCDAYCIHDDFVNGWGIVCGYTLDKKYLILGYDNEYGYIVSFNPSNVYIDKVTSEKCITFRYSKVDETMFYNS